MIKNRKANFARKMMANVCDDRFFLPNKFNPGNKYSIEFHFPRMDTPNRERTSPTSLTSRCFCHRSIAGTTLERELQLYSNHILVPGLVCHRSASNCTNEDCAEDVSARDRSAIVESEANERHFEWISEKKIGQAFIKPEKCRCAHSPHYLPFVVRAWWPPRISFVSEIRLAVIGALRTGRWWTGINQALTVQTEHTRNYTRRNMKLDKTLTFAKYINYSSYSDDHIGLPN